METNTYRSNALSSTKLTTFRFMDDLGGRDVSKIQHRYSQILVMLLVNGKGNDNGG